MARNGRRSNMEGSIYFDKARQRHIGQFSYKDPLTGVVRRKKITSEKRDEVVKAGKAFLQQLEQQKEYESQMTVKKLIKIWFDESVKNTVKAKTLERYEGVTSRYVIPHIGNMPVGEINAMVLQKLFNKLFASGGEGGRPLSPRSVNMTRTIMSAIFKFAVASDYMAVNPIVNTKPIKQTKAEIKVFTVNDYEKLIITAKEHSLNAYLLLRIAFSTGFRLGEIVGLEFEHVDWMAKTLSVKQTVVSTNRGKLLQKNAKTSGSIRKILIDDSLIEDLHEALMKHKEKKKLAKNLFDQKHNFVISTDMGDCIDPSHFSYRIFKKLLQKAGLDNSFRVHDCRHTHATWLIEKGVNIKAVSERLGHSSIKITMDTYSHVTTRMQEQAVNALTELLNKDKEAK